MTFASPHVLWLVLVPALWLAGEFARAARAVGQAHPKILRAEAGTNSVTFSALQPFSPGAIPALSRASGRHVRWRFQLGLAFALLALAQPQWGRIVEPVFEQARDILIAMDLSRSMLAPDVKPTRLERARLLVTSLLEKLHGERVGLVVFSGTAFLQSPLSGDYEILREFLPALGPDYLPEGGTNYSALADTALAAFGNGSAADRFLIILSDGEADDDSWRSRLDELKAKGVRIIGLGVGTAEGAMIPDGTGQFVKDERGAVVLTKLDSSTLRALADATGGAYADASGWVDLSQLLETTVERGRRGAFREADRVRLAERFQWVLAPALLLLAWSFWREFPVHPHPRALTLRTTATGGGRPERGKLASTVASLALFLISGFWLLAPPVAHAVVTRSETDSQETVPLPRLVARLAASPHATASDWAGLANETLTWGHALQSTQKPVAEGPVQDALAAVELGKKLDAKAADWPALRTELEKLLEIPDGQKSPPPDQSQQPNSKPDQPDKGQSQDQPPSGGQNQSKDPSSSSPSQNDPAAPEKPNPAEQPKSGDPQNQSAANSPDQPPPPAGQQTLGDMKSSGNQSPPPPSGVQPGETQQVGGTPTQAVAASATDPMLAMPLQKLDQLREADSPVRLYQLMQQAENPSAPDSAAKKHNW
ncbi:MAG: VWA domain-containing protein [Verrucomicrobiota bacterium]